jgi:hypothetical protein
MDLIREMRYMVKRLKSTFIKFLLSGTKEKTLCLSSKFNLDLEALLILEFKCASLLINWTNALKMH